MDAEKLAEKARSSISVYCIEDCKAYCCRKGYLELTKEELNLISNNDKKTLEDKNSLDYTQNETYLLDLGLQNCPSLKDSFCTIHKNPKRPNACKEFPLFIWENKIIHLSRRCPAVREEKLYPFIAKFKQMGYEIDDKTDIILD